MLRKILIILALIASIAFADKIRLTDGSLIYGKVTKITEGKLSLKTDFAGTIAIEAAKITSIDTDEPVNIATEEKKTTGKITDGTIDGNKITEIKYLWLDGETDPTLPKPRKWTYELAASLTGETGNSEKCNLAGGIKATLEGPDDTLKLYAKGKHSRENHNTSSKEVTAGFDYERHIKKNCTSWYARSEYEYDKINDLDPSVTSAAGLGYYIIDKPESKIRLRAGATHVYKDYVSDKDTESSMGMEFNYHHEFIFKKLKFTPELKQVTDISYLPVFEDFIDDYRITHESYLTIPLNQLKSLSLRLGVSNDYYGEVASGNEHMDTTYFMQLVLSWK